MHGSTLSDVAASNDTIRHMITNLETLLSEVALAVSTTEKASVLIVARNFSLIQMEMTEFEVSRLQANIAEAQLANSLLVDLLQTAAMTNKKLIDDVSFQALRLRAMTDLLKIIQDSTTSADVEHLLERTQVYYSSTGMHAS